MKKFLHRLFIDGLSGMALGLFSTLIIGTILCQAGSMAGSTAGAYISAVGNMAKLITGAGIGVGVASKFKESTLVTVSAAVAGMLGAHPVLSPYIEIGKTVGEPLGAFAASFVAVEIGRLVSGKTKLDIIITPLASIGSGALVGYLAGPYITKFMYWIGNIINVNVEKSPVLGGIVVSVAMGMLLTLPISSAAIGISMGLTGLAAGAATVGCCCQMVGFAVAGYRENKVGGLLAQGLGTSMLQMPNIVKRPVIWLPPILASAVLGPVSSAVLKMTSAPVGSGMGTAGLVGPIVAYDVMTGAGASVPIVMIEIMVMYFILPGVITLAISEGMRKAGWIRKGDMSISVQ